MVPIIYIENTESTNTFLKKLLADRRVEEGTTIYAKNQTAGRGQRGNSWESEEDQNLLVSMVIYPFMVKANEQFIISQLISVAIKNVLSKYTKDITIKWPNDIYWKNKKICGILIENALIDNKIEHSIIGFGLNINQEIFKSDAPNPISLKNITNEEYKLGDILVEILIQVQTLYKEVQLGRKAAIVKAYKKSLYRQEGLHVYSDGNKQFSAKIKDINTLGLLVLETEKGETREFAFKEVSYVI